MKLPFAEGSPLVVTSSAAAFVVAFAAASGIGSVAASGDAWSDSGCPSQACCLCLAPIGLALACPGLAPAVAASAGKAAMITTFVAATIARALAGTATTAAAGLREDRWEAVSRPSPVLHSASGGEGSPPVATGAARLGSAA